MKSRSSHEITTDLQVIERVRSVLQLRGHEQSASELSVAEVCRLSKVNRANLYARYPDLVAEILGRPIGLREQGKQKKVQSATVDLENLASMKTREKALLYLCLELYSEVQSLRARK